MNVLSSIRSNPLFVQQIRKPKRITARMIATGVTRLMIIVVCLTIISSVIQETTTPLSGLLSLLVIFFIAAFPFLAYATAIATVKEVKHESYDLLLVTTLTNLRISYGLLSRAFYRTRVWCYFS